MAHETKSKSGRTTPRVAQLGLDTFVLAASFCIAYLLRFDFAIPVEHHRNIAHQLPYVVVLELLALWYFGVYRFIWRYIGMAEMKAFIVSGAAATTPLLVIRLAVVWPALAVWRVPLSVIMINGGMAFLGVLGLRVLRRALYELSERSTTAPPRPSKATPVLFVGAGRAGVLAAKEVLGRRDKSLHIVGFVDDDAEKLGSEIHGIRVLGTTTDLPTLVRQHQVDHLVITIAQGSRQEMRRIVAICESIPVKARVIPGLFEIVEGSVSVNRMRDVDIEDLLGREPVQLEEQNVRRYLTDKVVMVTGAGGSIGSELARQVARFGPRKLLLVERSEGALFNIDRELKDAWSTVAREALVADIGDEPRMRQIFTCFRPDVVLHAAAHKHVPLMEANPCEAVKNNSIGTHTLGTLAGEFHAEAFVMISTDKAVNPTSVMGATKRIAELVVQDLDRRFPTRFVAVRFGNVLGSAGSVIPIFREQIQRGGPITVTHPDMRRYFMTIPEAAQLVLQAGAMGEGGEIFVLDMGEPVKIVDVAVDLIRLSGLRPYEDIDIVFSGMRPGEKLFEELDTTGEEVTKTRHPKVFIGRIAPCPAEALLRSIHTLKRAADVGDSAAVREAISIAVPESRVSQESTRRETGLLESPASDTRLIPA